MGGAGSPEVVAVSSGRGGPMEVRLIEKLYRIDLGTVEESRNKTPFSSLGLTAKGLKNDCVVAAELLYFLAFFFALLSARFSSFVLRGFFLTFFSFLCSFAMGEKHNPSSPRFLQKL